MLLSTNRGRGVDEAIVRGACPMRAVFTRSRFHLHSVMMAGMVFASCDNPALPPENNPEPTNSSSALPTAKLAPEGIFFLTEYESITSESGIWSMAPGTRVVQVEDLGDRLQVREDKGTTFAVLKHRLTNDLNLAESIRERDVYARKLTAAARADAARFVEILQATYGYGSRQVDVTDRVRADVRSGDFTVRSGNHLAERDPWFGKVKTLTLVYRVGGGASMTVKLREGHSLSLPASHDDLAQYHAGQESDVRRERLDEHIEQIKNQQRQVELQLERLREEKRRNPPASPRSALAAHYKQREEGLNQQLSALAREERRIRLQAQGVSR